MYDVKLVKAMHVIINRHTITNIYSFLLQLLGCGLLALGIWMLVDKNISSRVDIKETLDDGGNMLKYSAYVIIGAGAIIFFVAFCGCFGAWKENRCLLGTVSCIIIIISSWLCKSRVIRPHSATYQACPQGTAINYGRGGAMRGS